MSSIDDPDQRPAPGRRRGWGRRIAARRRRSRGDQRRQPVAGVHLPPGADRPGRASTDPWPPDRLPPDPLPPDLLPPDLLPLRDPDVEPATEEDATAPEAGEQPPGGRVSTSTVRPYVLTRGRTRSRWHLGWETLVSVSHRDTADPAPELVFDEERRVVELCAYPRSVAEVAAHLKIPVGVTRVVLGDLAERQILVVHDTGDTTDPEVLRRIIQRLREP